MIPAMANKRHTDSQERTFFRSERFFQHDGYWYFNTREGTIEGPFNDIVHAKQRMQAYIEVHASGMLGDDDYEVLK